MHIHFICRGNIYRSRLAEAYAKSRLKDADAIEVSSSGIQAEMDFDGTVADVVPILLMQDGIEDYMSPRWTQTTQEIIDSVDIVVFMSKTVHKDAKTFLDLQQVEHYAWNIHDTKGVYPAIKQQVDALLSTR